MASAPPHQPGHSCCSGSQTLSLFLLKRGLRGEGLPRGSGRGTILVGYFSERMWGFPEKPVAFPWGPPLPECPLMPTHGGLRAETMKA